MGRRQFRLLCAVRDPMIQRTKGLTDGELWVQFREGPQGVNKRTGRDTSISSLKRGG